MKFIRFNIKRVELALFCFLCALVLFSSCADDDDKSAKAVVLHSFGPAGVKHGDQIKFIGQNLDRVSSIALPGIEIASSNFVSQSSTLIELMVPPPAEAGKVILKTPDGEIQTKTPLNFLVPVVIESITAEARPGDNISIKGSMVNWIQEVVFNEAVSTTEFVSKSLEEIVVQVPREAQTGYLIFKTGGTSPLTFASQNELIVTMPVVTAMSPLNIKHMETLTITGTNLDLVSEIIFPESVTVFEFESADANQLTVQVPSTAKKGKITLRVPSGLEVIPEQEITIILPKGTSLTPNPAGPGQELTIMGTDLDLVEKIIFPDVATPVTEFVSKSATKIVVQAPDAAVTTGALFFVTVHGFQTVSGVQYKLPGNADVPLVAIYEDALHANWQQWGGWGTALQDMANTEMPRNGSNAIKISYSDAWGGFQLHPANPDPYLTDSYATLKLSIAGGSGTVNGTQLLVYIKTKEGTGEDAKVTLTLGDPDAYKTFDIPLTDFGSPSNINELVIQNAGTANATFYVDDIGLYGSNDPLVAVYDDAIHSSWQKWDGWGTSAQDVSNTELPNNGTNAVKITYSDAWGGVQFHPVTPDPYLTDSYSSLKVSVARSSGTADGAQILVYIKTKEGTGESSKVTLTLGASDVYKTFDIPLSDFGNPANISELVFQNGGNAAPATVYIDDIGLF